MPSSTIMSYEANEGLLVHETTAQESIGHNEPEILQEQLLGLGHRKKKTSVLLCDYVTHSI